MLKNDFLQCLTLRLFQTIFPRQASLSCDLFFLIRKLYHANFPIHLFRIIEFVHLPEPLEVDPDKTMGM